MSDSGAIQQGHKDGSLHEKVQEVLAMMAAAGTTFIAMITIPAMPVIYYMTMLYNVIMVIVVFLQYIKGITP